MGIFKVLNVIKGLSVKFLMFYIFNENKDLTS